MKLILSILALGLGASAPLAFTSLGSGGGEGCCKARAASSPGVATTVAPCGSLAPARATIVQSGAGPSVTSAGAARGVCVVSGTGSTVTIAPARGVTVVSGAPLCAQSAPACVSSGSNVVSTVSGSAPLVRVERAPREELLSLMEAPASEPDVRVLGPSSAPLAQRVELAPEPSHPRTARALVLEPTPAPEIACEHGQGVCGSECKRDAQDKSQALESALADRAKLVEKLRLKQRAGKQGAVVVNPRDVERAIEEAHAAQERDSTQARRYAVEAQKEAEVAEHYRRAAEAVREKLASPEMQAKLRKYGAIANQGEIRELTARAQQDAARAHEEAMRAHEQAMRQQEQAMRQQERAVREATRVRDEQAERGAVRRTPRARAQGGDSDELRRLEERVEQLERMLGARGVAVPAAPSSPALPPRARAFRFSPPTPPAPPSPPSSRPGWRFFQGYVQAGPGGEDDGDDVAVMTWSDEDEAPDCDGDMERDEDAAAEWSDDFDEENASDEDSDCDEDCNVDSDDDSGDEEMDEDEDADWEESSADDSSVTQLYRLDSGEFAKLGDAFSAFGEGLAQFFVAPGGDESFHYAAPSSAEPFGVNGEMQFYTPQYFDTNAFGALASSSETTGELAQLVREMRSEVESLRATLRDLRTEVQRKTTEDLR